MNLTISVVRVEQNVRFTKSLNFKEKKKLANETQHESSLTSSLAKPLKIFISTTTPVLLPSIEIIFANSLVNNPTIEAIHKSVHEET